MFWPRDIPDRVPGLQETLAAWDGCVWQLESYGMSHPTFTLWVYGKGRPTSLKIYCAMPRYIRGPTGWNGCQFTVRAQDAKPLGYLVIRDDSADFEIRCFHIHTEERPPPHWLAPVSAGGHGGEGAAARD
jgi:hypothetical protein